MAADRGIAGTESVRVRVPARKPLPRRSPPADPYGLIALQRAAGNHAAAGLVAQRLVVQRAEAPAAPGLISARFAGDAKLEACAADRGRLRPGDTGTSVTKVQQGLLDAGTMTGSPADLGPSGADGIYGSRTAAAVRAFKAGQGLGSEQFGDVGPGTIRRLDSLLSGGERPAAKDTTEKEQAEEEGAPTGSCPFDNDAEIETGLREGGLGKTVLGFAVEDLTAAPPTSGGPVGAGHVKIPDAVKTFKEKVDVVDPYAGRNISNLGQMFWGHQLWQSIKLEINRIAGAGAREAAWAAKANRNAEALYTDPTDTPVNEALRQEAAAMKSPERANMLALFAAGGSGGALEELWWRELNKTDKEPDFTKFRSLRSLRAVSLFDLSGCGTHVIKVAERLRKKGGVVPRDAKAKAFPFSQVTTGTGKRDLNPLSGGRYRGEVFAQAGVGSTAAAMRAALDAGQLLHARVVSGVGNGHGAPAPKVGKVVPIGAPVEEHSILIFGYDDNKFVFHDADAAVSHQFGGGFGFLFEQGGHLTTAETDADFAVSPKGTHERGDKRYQVIHISGA